MNLALAGSPLVTTLGCHLPVDTADEIIRDTYRAFLTQGLKGCFVYRTDKDLADYLRSCL